MVPHCNWRGAGLVWIFGIQTDPNSKSVRSCHILNLASIIFELKQIGSRASVNHHSITGHDEHGELLPCNKDAGKEPHQFMNMPFGGRAGWELASSWFELPKSWCENGFHGKLMKIDMFKPRTWKSVRFNLSNSQTCRDHGSRTWKKVEVPGESQRLRNNGWQVGILFPVAFGTHWSPGSPGSHDSCEARHVTTDADRPWTNFRGTTIHVTQGTCDLWSSSTIDIIWYYGKSFLAIVLQCYIYIIYIYICKLFSLLFTTSIGEIQFVRIIAWFPQNFGRCGTGTNLQSNPPGSIGLLIGPWCFQQISIPTGSTWCCLCPQVLSWGMSCLIATMPTQSVDALSTICRKSSVISTVRLGIWVNFEQVLWYESYTPQDHCTGLVDN